MRTRTSPARHRTLGACSGAFWLLQAWWAEPAKAQPALEGALSPADAVPARAPAAPDDTGGETLPPAPAMAWGAGVSLGFLRQRDFGEASRTAFTPELVLYRYLPLSKRWFLRPGVRLGYQGLLQVEMPESVRVEERALYGLLDVGILFDAMVVPSLSLGGGVTHRWIRLVTEGDAHTGEGDPLDRSEVLGMLYAQFGLGIPVERGRFLVEPYIRRQHTFSDDRSAWQFGFDATIGF